MGRPEQPVDAVERQGCTESFEAAGVESQAVDALEQGFHVSGAFLLLLGCGLFYRPFDKLLDAAATEVSQSAVQWIDHTILKRQKTKILKPQMRFRYKKKKGKTWF